MQGELTPPIAPARANKLLGLELLRFLTAFAILVFHYRQFAFVGDREVGLLQDQLPLYWLLAPFYASGPYAVRVFWCISGFIFFWKYRDVIADRVLDGWKFFVLRFSRLYPLHLATLLLVALLQPLYAGLHGSSFVYQNNDLAHFVLQLVMAGTATSQDALSFNGPIWSVSVEVLVYFVFFMLLLATRSWWLNVALIAVCLTIPGEVADCFTYFYVGGLAAMARQSLQSSPARARTAEGTAWLAVVAVVCGYWLMGGQLRSIGLLLLLICTPLLLYSLSRDIALPARLQRIVEAAGNVTYSSYLLHFPIQLAVVLGFSLMQVPIPIYDDAFFATFIGITLLASHVTYRYFEEPAQRLIRASLLPLRGEAVRRPAMA
ncbi:acyltransferase [Bradyrhizobium sp. WBOS7]|uniref:Acyltransferase n=1 Tax=Bradyrhizobium betae TaxID=244734 RepID=A0AAE9SN73_9BRAD|nr:MULTISPECIES: acyltransferase [Bradyrhizobium]MDD1572643.1 acyltransferase [Bradyrhizobium sp. WBOS1]UUO33496.1 acyltransferase [Bradyrhizobium sp. WBOS01]MDD1530883.1 acyltransferase [Bradyrhizobium sp. WBOS2]MDD1580375.1 acyltransferase [Bradyrhizobium sp. WBOS7]MDD1603677.1 acyltransferase [Bradyrhizobium sp. WBOS16]